MRFTNGYWLIRDGMQLQFPKIAYDSRVEAGKLTVYAPCMTMENKGNCLNGGTITIEFTAPRNDIIEVHAYHFKGAVPKGPAFSINRTKADVRIEETDKELVFASGDTSVRITKHPASFAMRFYYKETLLTQSLDKALGYAVYKGKTPYMKEELTLSVGEYVYGLGERFTAFVKNGQSVEIANRDGGTSSDQAYKNIPFYLTNRGYGVFTMQPEDISYEIASEKVNRVQFSVEGESLSYCVIGGGSMKRTLALYTDLTGKPALPPAWSFGLWLSTSFLTDYDTDTVTRFLDGMEQSGIPVSVFHFDCCWMEEFEWCNFKWNRHTFTDPERMLKDIHTRGIRVCVWINPYIGQKSPLFDEGLEHGYFLQNPDGSVYQRDEWQSGTALVDFTNPDAVNGIRIILSACWIWGSTALRRISGNGFRRRSAILMVRIPKRCTTTMRNCTIAPSLNFWNANAGKGRRLSLPEAQLLGRRNIRSTGEGTAFQRTLPWRRLSAAAFPLPCRVLDTGAMISADLKTGLRQTFTTDGRNLGYCPATRATMVRAHIKSRGCLGIPALLLQGSLPASSSP